MELEPLELELMEQKVRRGVCFGKRRKGDDEGFIVCFNHGEPECSRICGPVIDAIFSLNSTSLSDRILISVITYIILTPSSPLIFYFLFLQKEDDIWYQMVPQEPISSLAKYIKS